jgi:hypothetical protein
VPIEKLNTENKDVYPFIMDCSLNKKGNILIYELQPLVCSGLGEIDSRHIPAFKKAFPGLSFTLDYKNIQYPPKKSVVIKGFFSDIPPRKSSKYENVKIPKYSTNGQFPYKKLNDKGKYAYTLKKSVKNLQSIEKQTADKKILISDKFHNRNQEQNFNSYRYVHVPKDSVINLLGNKINQRLYLPAEVSPPYVLFDLSKDRDKELARIIDYFNKLKIDKIVLKHPEDCMGNGNIFIDSIQNEAAIKQGLEKLSKNQNIDNLPYLLVESQSAFPRVSRKTGEVKSGYTTYRIVGIADENGILGYFIASKSISSVVDSHQRNTFKFYFNGKRIVDDKYNNWIGQHCKPKDKYFNLGSDRILIDSTLLEKVFKSAYRLYHNAQIMTADEFKADIDSLILKKENSGLNIEKLKTKGLYESFISQFKALNLKDKIIVKGSIKQDKLNIYLSTPKPRSEVCLFLEKLVLKIKNITIKKYSSPSYFFFPNRKSSHRSSNIKITLPNNLTSYEILMEALKDTKAEITRKLTSEESVVVDLIPKL